MNKNIALSVLLALSLFSLTTANAGEPEACGLKQYASLDLTHAGNGFYLVPVTVQNSPEFMILNTSDGISAVTGSAATRLGMHIKSLPFSAQVRSGKDRVEKMATTEGFSFGGFTLERRIFS